MHQEALAIQEKLGNAQGIATALHNLGVTASALGDNLVASQFHERQLSIIRELGHRGSEALALNSLGFLASQSGDFVAATERYERALAIWRNLGDEHGVALALHNLATDAIRQDEIERARPMLRESLTIRARLDASGDLSRALSAVAEIARRTGYPGESVRLVSAACQRSVQPEQETPPELDEIRDKLGGTMFAAAWNEGMELSTDQAVGIALMVLTAAGGEASGAEEPVSLIQLRPDPTPDDHGLTAREIEVLRLIAAGRSNAEIGKALFISPSPRRRTFRICSRSSARKRARPRRPGPPARASPEHEILRSDDRRATSPNPECSHGSHANRIAEDGKGAPMNARRMIQCLMLMTAMIAAFGFGNGDRTASASDGIYWAVNQSTGCLYFGDGTVSYVSACPRSDGWYDIYEADSGQWIYRGLGYWDVNSCFSFWDGGDVAYTSCSLSVARNNRLDLLRDDLAGLATQPATRQSTRSTTRTTTTSSTPGFNRTAPMSPATPATSARNSSCGAATIEVAPKSIDRCERKGSIQ